jgi:shikimate 5-dehydrogenase
MSKPNVPNSRRKFLISIGAGGAATAAAVVAAVAPEPEVPTADGAKTAKSGYQVSEHINKYYRTTRV